MEELIRKYNIPDGFYTRYFKQNAEFRYGVELLQFLYFKCGKFLNPSKKDFYINTYINEEIDNFYNKNQINLPHLSFCITTKCSLKCKDCASLIPFFNEHGHISISLEEFKENLDKILASVNKIRRLILLGGEPLLYNDLDKIIDYSCKKENIDIVQIITNGTIIPDKKILKALVDNNKKVYLHISNYSATKDVYLKLKHNKIRELLKDYDIKLQMDDGGGWLKEFGFSNEKSNPETTIKKYKKCFCSHCTQVLNNKMYVCSKGSCAIELKLVDADDYVDLKNSKNLKQDIIDFYNKDYLKACEYCISSDTIVMPALQN